MIADIAARKI
jgi:hypothetical protein